jgi:hypothetical protein
VAKVTYGSDASRLREGVHEQGSGGTTQPVRPVHEDARVSPSSDPTNPYEENRWRLSQTVKVWSGLRPCKKEIFNHSFKLYNITGTTGKKSRQLQSGYPLALSVIINSLDPNTGSFLDPLCFCYQLVDPAGQPLKCKAHWFYVEVGDVMNTVYSVDIGQGERFKGSILPGAANWLNKLQGPVVVQRGSAYLNWIEMIGDRDEFCMWIPFAIATIIGTSHLWDCEEWRLVGASTDSDSGSSTLNLIWCPTGCNSSLCSDAYVFVDLTYGDGGVDVSIRHKDGSDHADVLWDGVIFGSFNYGASGVDLVSSFHFPPFKNNESGTKMIYSEDLDPCDYSPRLPGLVQKGDMIVNESRDCSCEGGGCDDYWYVFGFDEPIRFDGTRRNPEIKLVVDGPIYDGRGFQCFYPWGAAWIYVSDSVDGPWCGVFVNPMVEFVENQQVYCFDHRYLCNGTWRYIAVRLGNGPAAWVHCTKTTLKELYVNDKLYVPEGGSGAF